MICLPQGTIIDDVEAFGERLPSNREKLAYYKNYRCNIKIILYHLNLFIDQGDLRKLLAYTFLKKFLRTENVIVVLSSDPEQVKGEVVRLIEKLHCLSHNIEILMRKHRFYRKIKYEPVSQNVIADERIFINAPFAKLKKIFAGAKEKGLVEYDSDDDLIGHFRCTDSSSHYDKKKYILHRIRWLGSDNEFAIFIKEL